MAGGSYTLKLTVNKPLTDGKIITFKSPCDCNEISAVTINGTSYTLKDSIGKTVTGYIYWVKDAIISLTLDVTNHIAYILTNKNSVSIFGDTMYGSLYLSGDPTTSNQAATKHYVDTHTTSPYSVGATAPTDTKMLWIDTTATTGGLKYYDNTSKTWKPVPVQYT